MADEEVKYTTLVLTNNSKARQGVHTKTGVVFLNPGDKKSLEVTEAEAESLKAHPLFGIDGAERKFAPTLGEVNAGLVETGNAEYDGGRATFEAQATLLRQKDEDISLLQAENGAIANERDALKAERDTAVQELESLKRELDGGVVDGIVARHSGGGKFTVYAKDGTTVLMTKLTRAQSQELNTLPNDEAKEAWIAEHTKAD